MSSEVPAIVSCTSPPAARPLRYGWQTARLHDARNRRATDAMADALQGPLDPRVAPGSILLRHPDDQTADLREQTATPSSCRVRPFPRDQLLTPPENRVGRDDRSDLTESATAQPVFVHSQPTAFLIGQTDPAAQVRAEDAVFFDQMGNRLLPLVGPPAGHRYHEESNRSDILDRRSPPYRLHGAPRIAWAEKSDTTGHAPDRISAPFTRERGGHMI
jgi:hypothetical protein